MLAILAAPVGDIHAPRAVGARVGLTTVNGDVFKNPRQQLAVLIVAGGGQLTIVLVGIEGPIAVCVFAEENIQRGSINEAEFVNGLEGSTFVQAGRIEAGISALGTAAGFAAVAAAGLRVGRPAPADNGLDEFRRHARELRQHRARRRVEIELRRFVDEAEDGRGRRDLTVVATDHPELRFPHGQRLRLVIGDIGDRAVGREISENVARVANPPGDRLTGLDLRNTIVSGAQLRAHRVRKIKRQRDEAEARPHDDDEHGAAACAERGPRAGCSARDHSNPPPLAAASV